MRKNDSYEKYKHLIGTKINEWTILDVVVRNEEKHRTYLLAQCSCGEIKEMYISDIFQQTGKEKKDCGCGHRKRLDKAVFEKYGYLLGTTINGWTILKILPPNDKHKKTYALCLCRCGTIKEVKMSYLLNGNSKDCGCGRKETLSKMRSKDLTGQKFGKLLVIEKMPYKDKNGHTLYRCRCDCGNEIIVLGYSLVTKHTLSCGCLVSYYNMYIKQFLDKNNIENKPERTIFIGDNYYRFDFYLPQYNLFIEYDGEQHFKPIRYYTQTEEEMMAAFKKTQEHDRIKNKYCEDNQINLLRIPYWEKENIETIINNHLQRLSIEGYIAESV